MGGDDSRLKTLIEMWGETGRWEVCLIDCPPSLALLSDNALVAADQIIIPVEAEDSSLFALELLMVQLSSIRAELRIDPEVLGLVVNAYDKRRGYEVTSTYAALEAFKLPILATVKDLADLRRAWRAGDSVFDVDPDGPAAQSYTQLAKALIAAE
ncbi:ParA family protein [Glycomyces tenuis]|uniref:ParA family protein n=1 Tax=Glycomyces tenuis TaxID=58116 RepID=UPI00040A71A1|nr:ParA family protein [Glycomyces tenuis]